MYAIRSYYGLIPGDCPCGRTSRRIGRIIGRTDDMITVRGINVFPSQVEAILLQVEGAEPHYQIILERDASHLDIATVLVEAEEETIVSGSISAQQEILRKIERGLASELGVSFKVVITSYSIHYTKLYDNMRRLKKARPETLRLVI